MGSEEAVAYGVDVGIAGHCDKTVPDNVESVVDAEEVPGAQFVHTRSEVNVGAVE